MSDTDDEQPGGIRPWRGPVSAEEVEAFRELLYMAMGYKGVAQWARRPVRGEDARKDG